MDSLPASAPPTPSAVRPGTLSRRRRWAQYLVLGLLFLAVAVTFARGWNELAEYHWRIDQTAVGVALVLWTLTTVGAATCWLVVTRAFGVRLPIGPALRVFCTSNLGKYLPGKVLHVFARVYLVQQQGVPLAVGTTSAMLDVLLYIAAGMVVAVFALPLALAAFGSDSPNMALAGLSVLVGFGLLHPRVLNATLRLAGRFVPRFRGLKFELRYRAILGAFLLYLALWLLIIAAVYAGVRAVVEVAPAHAPILGAIFALSYVTGLVTPTPAGIGGREVMMALLFSSFMPFPANVVATLINRLLQVAAEALCAWLLSLLVRR